MSAGFTPWKASVEAKPAPARGHWYVVLDEEENGIGEFYGEDHETNAANLRIAATAPELCEVLAGLVDGDLEFNGESIVIRCGSHGEAIARARKARAALAKARGETA